MDEHCMNRRSYFEMSRGVHLDSGEVDVNFGEESIWTPERSPPELRRRVHLDSEEESIWIPNRSPSGLRRDVRLDYGEESTWTGE